MKNLTFAVLLALCLCAPALAHGADSSTPADDVPAAVQLPDVRAAAEQGNAAAQFKLGWMSDEGRGVAKDEVQAVAADCAVDRELIVLPPCAVRSEGGQLRVIPSHVAALSFNKYDLAPACLTGIGSETCWTYINHRGWVVVRDVAVMDNGASEFHHGLVRVTRDGKWGLADARGKLVVPLRYDGILEYEPGDGWPACEGCRTAQDKGREHSWFEGGKWLRLNARGKVIGPMQAPGSRTPQPEAHSVRLGNSR
jgi:hypothetical protein